MVPTIGLMIGFYIIARSLEMIGRSKGNSLSLPIVIFSVIAIVVAVIGIGSLLQSSEGVSQSFKGITDFQIPR